MMQTLEATLDESGHIHFAESVKISGIRRVLVTLLDASNESDTESGNGAAMRAFLSLHRLPASSKM